MRAHGTYNVLLRFAVDILIEFELDLQVYHIPGDLNVIADALSCQCFDLLARLCPGMVILPYAPPPRLDEVLRK